MSESKLILLTKIRSKSKAPHPNGIEAGFKTVGIMYNKPAVGKNFWVGHGFVTSPVIKIIDDYTFETVNGVYKYEEIKLDKNEE